MIQRVKKTMLPLEVKKTKSSKVASRRPVAPKEGTSTRPGNALGYGASVMASASVVEKILAEVILPTDKERVKKLSLDQMAKTLTN